MADQEHGQHEDAGLLGRGVEQMEVPALIHVGNFKEKDPPIFRGLPNEDVMEWIHQFQRVSVFHQWGAQQQLRHIEFSLEGVAERWLSGLDPRPNTIGGLLGALQRAFRHHNYAMELESRLRSRKQMDRLNIDELFRRLQAHSQAVLIAERSTPVNNILPVPPLSEDIGEATSDGGVISNLELWCGCSFATNTLSCRLDLVTNE
ncbi:hypothetical protein DAPPUDRAFT_115220 [Daphnia pulex]|uniref:Retrotransposon gag domain-containing protein n=1 Tax=Daphnia pulex TaxID=6669 RepID=E9HKM4_DAPPU|nr:hypothetical protein DAPPUDRAFT_115220 [Daphnia pulex]|eukprot:EFX67709.1 hypothetical protein DAPPUDRAFT_115220 [Daphnia pulex]